MKKRLIVLVALMLCVVTVLASCASSMKFEKVVGDGTYNDENPAFTTAAKLDVKGEMENVAGDLVIFEDVGDTGLVTYTVYNLATGATVFTATESRTESGENYTEVEYEVHAIEVWNTTLINVQTTTTTATKIDGDYDYDTKMDAKLLTATGTEIVSITDVKVTQMMGGWQELDLFCIDGKVYRVADDGSVAYAFDWSDLRGEPEIDEKVGEFYLSEVYGNGIAVYDASLNLVTTFVAPSYAGVGDMCQLSNGNVLIQYSVALDIMAEDYDYIDGAVKYNLYSFLLDAEKGKVKELDLDYIVTDYWYQEPGNDDWYFNEKIENFAWVAYIEDQRIDKSASAIKLVSLGNNGKIDGVIDELIPNMAPETPELVATNRWIVYNMVGQAFLLNEKGDVLGEVSGLDWDEVTADFFVLNGKIYDWDLNVKVDLAEQKCEGEYKVLDHSVLFVTEDEETKIYANGEVKTLIDKATAEEGKREIAIPSGCTSLFIIVDTATEGTVKIEVYNSVGAKLNVTIENVNFSQYCVVAGADSTNALLISGTDKDGETVYYRVG